MSLNDTCAINKAASYVNQRSLHGKLLFLAVWASWVAYTTTPT